MCVNGFDLLATILSLSWSADVELICVILSTLFQFLDDCSRHSSSQCTSAYSALGAVFGVDALCKSTFYLLLNIKPACVTNGKTGDSVHNFSLFFKIKVCFGLL